MKLRHVALFLLVMTASACGVGEPPRDGGAQAGAPLVGLVPPAGPYASRYAECLREHGATVSEVIGIYVVANQGSDKKLAPADSDCADQRQRLRESLENGRRVEDNDGNRFWYFVRGCMEQGLANHPRVDDDLLVVADRDPEWTKDFMTCVGIARQWPGESPSQPASPWPVYPSRKAETPRA